MTQTQLTKRESCPHTCSPSDYKEGGKCDLMGCYQKEEPIDKRRVGIACDPRIPSSPQHLLIEAAYRHALIPDSLNGEVDVEKYNAYLKEHEPPAPSEEPLIIEARDWWHINTSKEENKRLWDKYYPDYAYLTDQMVIHIYQSENKKEEVK